MEERRGEEEAGGMAWEIEEAGEGAGWIEKKCAIVAVKKMKGRGSRIRAPQKNTLLPRLVQKVPERHQCPALRWLGWWLSQ